MTVQYDLIKEQIFFRRELEERVFWFIRLRWVVSGGALAACLAGRLAGLDLPLRSLAAISCCILFYNGLFLLASRRLSSLGQERLKHYTLFAHLQISLDLTALVFVIYFTGGIGSPLLILVMLHVVLAGILLPRAAAFAYGFCVLLAVGVEMLFGGAAPLSLSPAAQPAAFAPVAFPEPPQAGVRFLLFALAVMFSAFAITSVRVSLRSKAREILRISKELDAGNAKLTALYEMVKEMEAITELQHLMDTATRQAAAIMGVKACSIKLMDEQKRYLEFSSTYGLSEDYLAMGKLDLKKSPINRQIIEGSPCVIGSIDEKDHFQYPENIAKEGIASMLCLPLRGNNRVLGVFCIYGTEHYRFQEKDVDFFSLMSDLTGMAIERAKWDLTKSWFMAKVTHNLRSPLNAILSMVSLVRKEYLGPVTERQAESLTRCENRILIMAEIIGDLLKIGRERTEMGRAKLQPVALDEVLQPLMPLFQNLSLPEGLDIAFDIADPLPRVAAQEGLLEDLFTNLIGNAIKYTPPGGWVRVELGIENPDWVRLDVSDTGIGIPEADLPRLFTEFFRAENAKKLAEEGTGLGLAIVKEIVDRLGGKIRVRSKIGEGTTFTCLLPRLPPP
jgi:hypothetical protein